MQKLTINSLASRQFFASAILLPVLLGIIAFALDKAFYESQITAEHAALQTQIYLLIGAAEPDNNGLTLPEELSEPRYSLPESGLYAAVVDEQNVPLWQSQSLIFQPNLLQRRPTEKISAGQELFLTPKQKKLDYFRFSYDIIWNINGSDQNFRIIVFHSADTFYNEINIYRKTLWYWLGILAVLLVITQVLIVRWGLIPLKKLATELSRFQHGESNRLEGKYPAEISPVTENLNAVLNSEKKQRERYRNTLSDLAHSLKTPLAVIRAESAKKTTTNTSSQHIDEQVSRMADIINHQLQRATLKSTHVLQQQVAISPILTRLGRALQKVYADKKINFSYNAPEDITFPGEEADAMELFGNIIENAFKYGNSRVSVQANINNKLLKVTIEDDGPGVPSAIKRKILERGARADTSIQGQGIGLAIAVDIISSYNGGLTITDSASFGGANFCISLPTR